jgi:bifunctional DNA-binding transcriptional regulator/antitoxin component of YhaV-PrlF toxin-antitoxin module
MALEEIPSIHYIGKVLSDGYISIPQTIFEQMGLKYGDEVEVALRKATSVETELPIPEEARALIKELVGTKASLKEAIKKLTFIATEMAPPKKQQRMSHLLWKNQDGTIISEEEKELDALVSEGQQQTIRKAKAILALKHLGIDIVPEPATVEIPKKLPAVDETMQKVLRTHFAKQILRELQQVEQNCGEPIAAVYVDSLFSKMRTMRDLSPTDPFVEVLMALYDAMAANNNWFNLKAHQLREAASILKKLLRRRKITENAVEQAILSLEDIGFDTTPFGGEIGEEE